ncbi:hypothetical protein Pfo_026531 [Paulownia fortunei]|nr:hypothetical protein Pfo_026531 [Paulownia fortunei]
MVYCVHTLITVLIIQQKYETPMLFSLPRIGKVNLSIRRKRSSKIQATNFGYLQKYKNNNEHIIRFDQILWGTPHLLQRKNISYYISTQVTFYMHDVGQIPSTSTIPPRGATLYTHNVGPILSTSTIPPERCNELEWSQLHSFKRPLARKEFFPTM